jgi:serine/threonine protein kinase
VSLTPGTRRLGSYEITAQIGAGGMGEVYKATDTNLKRSVAIKVLPATVAGDAERLARFQREAEVLAALNHPNIAAIYGLERSGATTALVMELVPQMAEIFRQKATTLAAGLEHDDQRDAARQALRGFLEKIVIPPKDGLLQVVGNFGAMLTAASGRLHSGTIAVGVLPET